MKLTKAALAASLFALLLADAGTARTEPEPPAIADAPRMEDDVPAAHRHAEAHRKSIAAARWDQALRRTTTDPNQEKWDVGFVELDLGFDTTTEWVSGTVAFTATVLEGPLDRVVLDLDATLGPSAATAAQAATTFIREGDRVSILLDREYTAGETVSFSLTYAGPPDQSHGAFGVETVSSERLIWTLSEPFGARTWWPCKDTPADKADSASIKFTVPAGMTAVSNGTLERVVDLGTERRFEWFERYPITTYLVSIAAYPYTEQTLNWQPQIGDPLPVTVWSWPSEASAALNAAYVTRDMLGVFEGHFGPYPFLGEKYGQAQFTWGGGMEHQTASSMCCWFSEGLIAHELAHQWFGDQVTCADFTEIWVNEGFATYSEALWREHQEGWTGYVDEMLAARYLGAGTIRVPESSLDDFGRIFSGSLSYNKASWVLHMLRGVIGDTDFFAFLKAYASDPNVSYGVATTDDVRRVAEQVSGRDLSAFFHQWIDEPWYPTYRFDTAVRSVGAGYEVDVELEQLQTHHVFEMPVTVRVTTASGSTDHVINSDEVLETVTLGSPEMPQSVELDPDHWVLHAVEATVPEPSFDKGLLVVNGVSWSSYGAEITQAYADSAFSGTQPFDFWDVFAPPAGGYVAELPTPRGNGAIPPAVLGEYEAVVWVGNSYQGDLTHWIEAAVLSYMQQGGNLLLMTRLGRNFLTQPRLAYLGADFLGEADVTTGDAQPEIAGLVPMGRLGTQSYVAPLDPDAATLGLTIFRDAADPSRSLGHWRPSTGGDGHFVHFAGRPYRWSRSALRQNVDVVLTQLFGTSLTDVESPVRPTAGTRLLAPAPNPFNPRVSVRFVLEQNERVRVDVVDVRGRHVRTLLDESRPSGQGAVVWDGTDDAGQAVASGVYTILFHAGTRHDRTKVTLVR